MGMLVGVNDSVSDLESSEIFRFINTIMSLKSTLSCGSD